MAKTAPKLPSFCLNRIRPHVRVRSPPLQAKKLDTNLTKQDDQKTDQCTSKDVKDEKNENGAKPKLVFSRKIMVVVDSSIEAKGALQWTLSHTTQNQDKLILLHVTKQSSKQGLIILIIKFGMGYSNCPLITPRKVIQLICYFFNNLIILF